MNQFPDLVNLYTSEFDDLFSQMKEEKISKSTWSMEYWRMLGKWGMIAQQLGEHGSMDAKTFLDGIQPRFAEISLSLLTEIDPTQDLQDQAWMLGYCTIKTIAEFRAKLWGAVKRLFQGGRDANFIATFVRTIDAQLTEAWNAGALEAGVSPDEMVSDDFQVLEAIINNENKFVERMASDILAAKDEEMEPAAFESKFSARVDLWANRYTETVNRARMHFGSKEKWIWVEGPTEDKCNVCPRLAGIIAFGYEWESAGVHPQMPPNPILECGGWNCLCEFKKTKAKRSPRALDQITHIVMTR